MSQSVEDRLVALEERIAMLEAELAQKGRPSMKRNKRCSCCDSGSILRVAHVGGENNVHWVALQHGFFSDQGKLELFVCRVCHFIEWHVTGLEKVRVEYPVSEYATEPLAPDPESGPYR